MGAAGTGAPAGHLDERVALEPRPDEVHGWNLSGTGDLHVVDEPRLACAHGGEHDQLACRGCRRGEVRSLAHGKVVEAKPGTLQRLHARAFDAREVRVSSAQPGSSWLVSGGGAQ